MYGGTSVPTVPNISDVGLSPRVRGILVCVTHPQAGLRSIPACTGEPTPARGLKTAVRVYPRVYGGTLDPPK